MKNNKEHFMLRAIDLAETCVNNHNCAPFGSLIVKNGQIISEGMESTSITDDPTSHSEIVAIRNACSKLKTTNLTGCELYTSSEPCSMCLTVIMWTGIKKVYYACSRKDVLKYGFADMCMINVKIKSRPHFIQMCNTESLKVFKKWKKESSPNDMH